MNTNFINYTFTGFIIVMCLALCGFMLFTDMFNDRMTETKRLVFVIIMLTYASFRSYRLIRSVQQQRNNSEK